MKLQTSILPRRDGTITVTGLNGLAYKFEASPTGELEGDVDHEPTVLHLLAGGHFFPADDGDFQAAGELLKGGGELDQTPAGDQTDAGVELDGDDEVVGGGLPQEANTPPVDTPAAKPAVAARGKRAQA